MVMAPPPSVTQQYRLASMATWLSSTCIFHHDLLPHIPSIHLSAVKSSPCPGITLQSLNSSSQLLTFQGTSIPVWGMYGCGKDCLILIPFRLPQTSCFTLSLKCFSFDSNNCPDVGIGPLLQFPHPLRADPVLLTLLFPPLVPCPAEFCVILYILYKLESRLSGEISITSDMQMTPSLWQKVKRNSKAS